MAERILKPREIKYNEINRNKARLILKNFRVNGSINQRALGYQDLVTVVGLSELTEDRLRQWFSNKNRSKSFVEKDWSKIRDFISLKNLWDSVSPIEELDDIENPLFWSMNRWLGTSISDLHDFKSTITGLYLFYRPSFEYKDKYLMGYMKVSLSEHNFSSIVVEQHQRFTNDGGLAQVNTYRGFMFPQGSKTFILTEKQSAGEDSINFIALHEKDGGSSEARSHLDMTRSLSGTLIRSTNHSSFSGKIFIERFSAQHDFFKKNKQGMDKPNEDFLKEKIDLIEADELSARAKQKLGIN